MSVRQRQREQGEDVAGSAEQEVEGPTLLEELEGNGVTAADIKKLRDAGYYTVEGIAFTPRKNLLTIKGISEAKTDKILAECIKLVDMSSIDASKNRSISVNYGLVSFYG